MFEHAMGTNVFFTENSNPPPMDPNFESVPPTMYKYYSQTDKVLKMERVFITPKKDHEEDEFIETQCDEEVVPKESYSEALDDFLSPGELPPRILSGSDILKPNEFQSFFRPTINQVADDQQSETLVEEMNDASIETSDNSEQTEIIALGSDSTEINVKQVKLETVEQE